MVLTTSTKVLLVFICYNNDCMLLILVIYLIIVGTSQAKIMLCKLVLLQLSIIADLFTLIGSIATYRSSRSTLLIIDANIVLGWIELSSQHLRTYYATSLGTQYLLVLIATYVLFALGEPSIILRGLLDLQYILQCCRRSRRLVDLVAF